MLLNPRHPARDSAVEPKTAGGRLPIPRRLRFLLLVAVMAVAPGLPAAAQVRLLVSPDGDARALTGRESAAEIVRAEAARLAGPAAVCTDKGTFGYAKDLHPQANIQFEAFHRDIMAMWYIAPANGKIDTVFVYNLDVGTQDSTVTFRLFESNIHPGSGPGYGGYPKPGKLCWGYYLSTNDDDNGLAAFPEDATDTTWYSTVPGALPSFTPMGAEIWGFGGFPKVLAANATNHVALAELAEAPVTAGQPFFITIRMYGPHVEQAEDRRTGYLAVSEPDSLQTHNWKFYEHIYQGPGFTCPGWVARGDFNFLIWYSMTVTTNLPPAFSDVTPLGNTLSTADRVLQATIVDCDAATPARAGVEQASIRYEVNGTPRPEIPLTYLGGDIWEGTIPGGAVGDRISYRLVASDSTGFADSTAATGYRVVGLANGWYAADTGASCVDRDIRSSGTTIPPSAFFQPGFPGAGTLPMDDGTAGPFDMGSAFTLFGDTFRHAWVGVNGALALSAGATDTLDVNSNGFATRLWDFPNAWKDGRADTAGAFDMPGMFIAPLWTDLILADSAGEYGRIVVGNDGDSCLFIVEWDSVGTFDAGAPVSDATTFRAVLDRCSGTVEFQYANVGTYGLEERALAGMQGDSTALSGPSPGWIYLNREGAPSETMPRNGWCVRFHPTVGVPAADGWNMVAVSHAPASGDYATSSLFPSTGTPPAVSQAFRYSGGYLASDTLQRGAGYWIKFSGSGTAGSAPGLFAREVDAPVQDKWNMIGGPSGIVPVSSIVPSGVTVASSYFGYGPSGYEASSTLREGRGYWVKVAGNGHLAMSSWAAAPVAEPQARARYAWESGGSGAGADDAAPTDGIAAAPPHSITFRDAAGRSGSLFFGPARSLGSDPSMFELPPPPPGGAFDLRFSSGRFAEPYPDGDGTGEETSLPIALTGAAWPVSVSWEIGRDCGGSGTFVLRGGGRESAAIPLPAGGGTVLLRAPSEGGLSIGILASGDLPSSYALGANYPNPFNPVTRFAVSLPTDSRTEVTVYDLLGRTVRLLADGPLPAGVHPMEWDGRDERGIAAPSGVYLLRMRAGTFAGTIKLLLLR